MKTAASGRVSVMLALVTGCGDAFDVEMPPQAAASEYLAYRTDADPSVVCMDDLLAREDRYIEHVAALLGVDTVPDTIDFVWDPEQDGSEPWVCEDLTDCYKHRADGALAMVVSKTPWQHHELVHAVAIPALGSTHPVLEEGLAMYLGFRGENTHPLHYLVKALQEDIETAEMEQINYPLAMHFVGTIIERHGYEKYVAFRRRIPRYARLEEFAAQFAEEFGQPLDEALEGMRETRVTGVDWSMGCDEGEAPLIEWTSERAIDTTIESECGDPWFYGPGFVDGAPGFYGRYAVEVQEEGHYRMIVLGPEGPVTAKLTSCVPGLGGIPPLNGGFGQGLLRPGRYLLELGFPAGPQARGAASLQLEYSHASPW